MLIINIFITTDHKRTKIPLKKKVDSDDPQPTSSSNGNGTRIYFSFQGERPLSLCKERFPMYSLFDSNFISSF